MSDPWKFRIARLELEPGDVLVVQGDTVKYENAHASLQPLVPHGVKILYVPNDINFSVLTRKKIEEMAK